jgi:predicted DNA binding CopG/RHH family protein
MKKEYDLRKLTPRAGKAKSAPDAAKIAVSIRLDGGVLADLRTEAHRLGIPYQTLIGSILHRYAHGDLIDPKAVKLDRPVKRAS